MLERAHVCLDAVPVLAEQEAGENEDAVPDQAAQRGVEQEDRYRHPFDAGRNGDEAEGLVKDRQ
ncbi:hypothetical protein [Micromonospora sp. NPDC003776]